MGHWVGQSPGTSEQQLQKKEAAEDRGDEGSFDACAGARGRGDCGWGRGCNLTCAANHLESEFSNCYVPRSQDVASSFIDIRTPFQLHFVMYSAIYMVSNDVDTSLSLGTLPDFLLAVCCCVGAIARRALDLGVGARRLTPFFRVFLVARACISFTALACKTELLIIRHMHYEGHFSIVVNGDALIF